MNSTFIVVLSVGFSLGFLVAIGVVLLHERYFGEPEREALVEHVSVQRTVIDTFKDELSSEEFTRIIEEARSRVMELSDGDVSFEYVEREE
jgi:hypothetical protein